MPTAAQLRNPDRFNTRSAPPVKTPGSLRGPAGNTAYDRALAAYNAQQPTQADIDAEIAQLEQELAGLPAPQTVGTGPSFTPPQAPGLPGGEMLQNPLLQAIQDDVTRRVFANQAAKRRTGAGETAVALQGALAPTALNLGLTQQAREQAQQQQNIDNLFRLFGMGANVAAGQGQAGMTGASNIGTSLMAGGQAAGAGALGQANALTSGLGGLAQIGGFAMGGGFGSPSAPVSQLGGGLFGTPYQPTTSIPFTA